MNYLIYLVLCAFNLITIHSEIRNIIDKSSHHTTHYTSYHLDWNNPAQWSVNDEIPLNLEIIACAVDIPSLCIYAFPPHPGFYVFYKDKMYDFLSDSNWTQITVTNNHDTESYHQLMHQLIDKIPPTKVTKPADRRRLFHLTPCFTQRCRERRAAQKSTRRCGTRCKMRAAGTAAYIIHRGLKYLKQRKERKRVYNKLYRFGRKMGRAMKTGNFAPLCGLTGGCAMGYPYHHRMRYPTRYMSYLGRPHVVGRPEYILGSPPVGASAAPMGYGMSQHFAMNLGGGMMNGMGSMHQIHPAHQGMYGMNQMHPAHQGMYGMNGMMGGLPGNSGWMTGSPMILGPGPDGTMGGLHDIDYAFGGDPYGAPHGMMGAVHSLLHRRRMMGDDVDDIRLKKCVLISAEEEICAIFYYMNDRLGLEYNVILDEQKKDKKRHGMSKYLKGNVWILSGDDLNTKQCNENVLEYIGYTVCVQRMDDGAINVYGVWENAINLMKDDEAWNAIYDVDDGDARKLCRNISLISICFEVSADGKMIQITTERLLSLEEAQ